MYEVVAVGMKANHVEFTVIPSVGTATNENGLSDEISIIFKPFRN
jgi:hypothetical protein